MTSGRARGLEVTATPPVKLSWPKTPRGGGGGQNLGPTLRHPGENFWASGPLVGDASLAMGLKRTLSPSPFSSRIHRAKPYQVVCSSGRQVVEAAGVMPRHNFTDEVGRHIGDKLGTRGHTHLVVHHRKFPPLLGPGEDGFDKNFSSWPNRPNSCAAEGSGNRWPRWPSPLRVLSCRRY